MSTCNCGPRGHGPECTAQAGEIAQLREQVRELKNEVGATTEQREMIHGAAVRLMAERDDLRQRLERASNALVEPVQIVEAMRPDVQTPAYYRLRLNRLLLEARDILLPPQDAGKGTEKP
jgi:hypothetical protein